MAVFRLGSRGDEVRSIQQALGRLGLYRGPDDGDFGGGTQAAVVAFQRGRGLEPDGKVGPATWQALVGEAMPQPTLVREDLARRCLALTGAFETGAGFPDCFCGVSGDFDGQGISLGVLQWNFGQRSLQPLLLEMIEKHPGVAGGIFGDYLPALHEALQVDQDELLTFARSVQHPVKHTVFEPWRGFARALGRTPEFQDIQTRHAADKFRTALRLCGEYGLASERAVALMFDIVVQNGSIGSVVRAQIHGDVRGLPATLAPHEREVRIMESVANRRAEAANPRWIDDVRSRKLCIARGGGTVHGIDYDLEGQFGLTLQPFAA
ncbi:MAG TPA: peptidoglycan-binding domain-containing protein [Gemmatimonadales bacterium]|nr:peptidoglycan-binding domain-containing protein [Gemmatimonadales bacterium]